MPGINQIERERAARPVHSGPSHNLFLKNGDIAFFHFIGTGHDDDPYMEVFLAHELPPSGDSQWPVAKYCPVLSQHDLDYPCPNCVERSGVSYKTKERMRMWFYVYNILHKTQRDGEALQVVQFGGQNYFNRVVNRPLVWDNSAWRESPLDSIIFEYNSLGNLRNSQFTMRATGDNKDRRYRLTQTANSTPFDPNLLNEHADLVKPIREMLLAEIKPVETVVRPDAPVEQFSPQQQFTPANGVPQTDPSLLASAPPPGFIPGQAPATPDPTGLTPPTEPEPVAPFQPVAGTKPNF